MRIIIYRYGFSKMVTQPKSTFQYKQQVQTHTSISFDEIPKYKFWGFFIQFCIYGFMPRLQYFRYSSCMLNTWQLSPTLWKSVCQSSRHGRRTWRTKGWESTWRRLSSWSQDLVLMFSVTLVNFNVLSVGTVLDRRTQSNDHSASSGCIRGAAVSRAELLQTKTMFAQGVVDKLVQLMAEQSHSRCR